MSTKQFLFDKVASHLLKQMERSASADGTICVYRSSNGLSCAVGCLISDEHYCSETLEGRDAQSPWVYGAVEDSLGIKLTTEEQEFLAELQKIHDNEIPFYWKKELESLALQHCLDWNY